MCIRMEKSSTRFLNIFYDAQQKFIELGSTMIAGLLQQDDFANIQMIFILYATSKMNSVAVFFRESSPCVQELF